MFNKKRQKKLAVADTELNEILWYEPKKCLIFNRNSKATPEFWDSHWPTDEVLKKRIISTRNSRYWSRILAKYLPDKSARILEGGCGYGHLVDAMNYWGYEAFGVDFAKETIKNVTKLIPELNVRIGDVRHLEFQDAFFDGYLSLGVIEHFWDGYEAILTEIYRVLKPGGYVFIGFPCVSFADRIKKFYGGYKKYRESVQPSNFFQFGLNTRDVIKDLERIGFEHIKTSYSGGITGMIKLLPCTKGIYDITVKLNKKGGLPKTIINAISIGLGPICGHGVLIVMRKS